MIKILESIAKVPHFKSRKDEDFADRLFYIYSPILIVIFVVIITTTELVGEPIHCLVPANFSLSQVVFANNFCRLQNTYHLPEEETSNAHYLLGAFNRKRRSSDMPTETKRRDTIHYSVWTPLVLLLQAGLSCIPAIVWRNLNKRSGMNIHNIVTSGMELDNERTPEGKEKSMKFFITKLHSYLSYRQWYSPTNCLMDLKRFFPRQLRCGRRHGNFLTALYTFVKVLTLLVVIIQFIVLHFWFNFKFEFYGFYVLVLYANGDNWTPPFPWLTICDLKMRLLGTEQNYELMCLLPLNPFYKIIYFLIWVWLMILASAAVFSLIIWSGRACFARRYYIEKRLQFNEKYKVMDKRDRINFSQFFDSYLKQDGVLILRFIEHNTGPMIVSEIVCALFEKYNNVPNDDTSVNTNSSYHTASEGNTMIE